MTYINLLPPEDRRKQLDYRHWLLIAGVLLGVVLLVSLYLTAQFQLDALYAEYEGLEKQLAMTQPMLGKVNKMEGELKEWEQRLHVAEGLDQRSEVASTLVLISNLIPPQVSLQRMNQIEQDLILEGESADYRGIATLMDALEGSGRFTGVELVSSFVNQDGTGFIGFRIQSKCKL